MTTQSPSTSSTSSTLSMPHKTLYHGSAHRIDRLEPRPSKVIEGEEAVFATDSKDMAVIFIPKWSDCDFSLGYHHNRLYMLEMYPNAFDILKKKEGYLYSVDPVNFISDPRLGMQHHEFISKSTVSILNTEKIEDVYEYAVNSSINMITYNDMLDALFDRNLMQKQ